MSPSTNTHVTQPQTTPTYCSGGVEKGVSDNLLLSSSSIVTIKVIKICNDISHKIISFELHSKFLIKIEFFLRIFKVV